MQTREQMREAIVEATKKALDAEYGPRSFKVGAHDIVADFMTGNSYWSVTIYIQLNEKNVATCFMFLMTDEDAYNGAFAEKLSAQTFSAVQDAIESGSCF